MQIQITLLQGTILNDRFNNKVIDWIDEKKHIYAIPMVWDTRIST